MDFVTLCEKSKQFTHYIPVPIGNKTYWVCMPTLYDSIAFMHAIQAYDVKDIDDGFHGCMV